jgi:hypothetical protein
MRIRIIQTPTEVWIDGLCVDRFIVGQQYKMGNLLGALFLSEGWAEPVDDIRPALVIPLHEMKPDAPESLPHNLIRETYPPYCDDSPAVALDGRRGPRRTRQETFGWNDRKSSGGWCCHATPAASRSRSAKVNNRNARQRAGMSNAAPAEGTKAIRAAR